MNKSLAQLFCDRVDWDCAELKASVARRAFEAGDYPTAAVALIHHLRHRATPHLGYTVDYVQLLRSKATRNDREGARQRWDQASEKDLGSPYHGNAFACLGAETMLLAATPDRCRRLSEKVLAYREQWTTGLWGVTQSICHLLRYLWPLNECADVDLLPIFGWLIAKSRVEWERACQWNENLLGTSGHNWWAHTFFGFWMMGTFFPEFRGWTQFRAFADGYLEREIGLLFEEDGWSKEGASGYHAFAADNLMTWAHLAQYNGHELSEPTRQRLRVIATAGWKMITPDGNFPVFGDSVHGSQYQGFHGSIRPDSLFGTNLRRRAARFGIPQAKFVAQALDPEWQPPYGGLLPEEGNDVLADYQRLSPTEPLSFDTSLPRTGYYVMRQDWTAHADCLAINAGTLGPRITSHKHADIFNFELYSRGRRILVDNWYGSVAEERKDDRGRMWRVSSVAHNVTTVDGADHVPIIREFLFGGTVVPTVDEWRSEKSFAYFSGVHEGYIRPPINVAAVRRKVFYLRGRYWILIDRFTAAGEKEHSYQLHFHLNAPASLAADGRVITQGSSGNLLILPVAGVCGSGVLEPNPHPLPDYENPQHLCYTRKARGNDLFVTLMVPFDDDRLPKVSASLAEVTCDERVLSSWEATGLNISWEGDEHFYFDQHLHWNLPWRGGKHQGARRLFHSQCMELLK